MKMNFLVAGICGVVFTIGSVYATEEEQQVADVTVTSRNYVRTQVDAKQDKIGAGTNGSVVTYTGSQGVVGEKAVYNESASYNSGALVEAGQVNTAIQNGINNHLECAETRDGVCVLWRINTLSGPHFNHG